MNPASTVDPNQNNPYRSPLVPNELFHRNGSPSEAERRGFRWRIIPVTMLYLYGGSLVFVSLLATIHMAVWSAIIIHRGGYVRFAWAAGVLRGSLVAAVLGALFIFAAKDFWRRRWLRGALEALAAVTLYAAFASLGGRLLGI